MGRVKAVTMKVTLISEYFFPDQDATGRLLTELALGLVATGIDVDVITAQPSYHGRTKRRPPTELVQQVRVRRVECIRQPRHRHFARVLNSTSFAAAAAVELARSKGTGPVVIVTCPPQTLWLTPFITKTLRRPVALLIHDLYPEIAEELGLLRHRGMVSRLWKLLNAQAFHSASRIVVLGPFMKQRIEAMYSAALQTTPVEVVHNWTDTKAIVPIAKHENWFAVEHGLVEPFVVQMCGNLGLLQEFDSILAAAESLQQENILFLFTGEGAAKQKLLDFSKRVTNVKVLDFQPEETFPLSIAACDVCLISLKPGVEGLSVPSRMYPALAAGRPILAVMHPDADASQCVRDLGFGATVSNDPSAIRSAILDLRARANDLQEKVSSVRGIVERSYSQEAAVAAFSSMLREIAAPQELERVAAAERGTLLFRRD